jgi:hypothetical protein
MTTGPAPRKTETRARSRADAALIGAGSLCLAVLAAAVSSWLAIEVVSSLAARVVVVVVLGLVTVGALVFASDSFERALDRGGRRWPNRLYWLSTSVVTLALVILLGIAATFLLPQQPGVESLLLDLAAGAILGAAAGALTAVLTTYTGRLFGWAFYRAQYAGRSDQRAERQRTRREAAGPARVNDQPASRWAPRPEGRGQRLRSLTVRLAAASAAGLLVTGVCTAIVTTATRNHTGAADTPAPVQDGLFLTVLLPVALWFVTTGFVWWIGDRRRGTLDFRHRQLHGTHAASLALCLFIVVGWFQAAGVDNRARHALSTGRALPDSDVPTVRLPRDSHDIALAAAFEPQLRLSRGERWAPTSVAWYARQNPRPIVDPPFCDKGGANGAAAPGCYETPGCDDLEGTCAPNGADDPAIYYRVRSSTDPPQSGDTPPRAGSPPWTLIQYWVFYNYDALKTHAVDQWHQGDWEQVTVLLERHGRTVTPVEVAYSAHCYGARLPANRVRWADRSHPVVYVALGSHANYPRGVNVPVRQVRCGLGVSPRYLGVAGLFFAPAFDGTRVEIPLDYIAGLRDEAAGNQLPARQPLADMDATPAIASFRGFWGLDNNLSPAHLWRHRSGAGPPAPQVQDGALKPFRKMFCNDRWIGVRGLPRWVCSGT